MALPTIVPLTTQARIEARAGQMGVDLRIDDDIGSITDAIADATVETKGYVSRLYSDDQLALSNWVELKVRDIALYFLAIRRGNPAPDSVQAAYEKAIADLTAVQDGQTQIFDISMNKTTAPVLTNQRMNVYPFPNIVNVQSRTTGNPEGYRPHNDPTDISPDY